MDCKREASGIRRAVASDRSANDTAKQVTMNRERETWIHDTPAVPNEPTDHAAARGRDVSLRCEGGRSPENHTVVLEWCWKPPNGPQRQRPLRPALTVSRTRCCKLHDQGARAPTASDHEGRNAEWWCWRCRRGIQETVNYHKVSLERIRDKATAKEPVLKEKYRRNHSQGASGENPRTEPQPTSQW